MTTNYGAIQFLLVALLLLICRPAYGQGLSLERAESIALDEDPGYQGLIKQSLAFEDMAVSNSRLPDPMLMVGLLNLPIEDFETDREPMSQLRVSVKQSFPSGDTLAVKRNSALADAARTRQEAVTRRLSVLQKTRNAWLETYYWEAALQVVKENEPLFEQLRDVTASFYSTGRKGLDDVLRSELELQRLKDREVRIEENVHRQRAFLARWIGDVESRGELSGGLPALETTGSDRKVMRERLVEHPLVQSMDKRIEKLQQGVALAREDYKPGWALEFAYAYRDARRPDGTDVSDLASVVASMSLPLFTGNRQDKRMSAASQQFNAGLDQRLDLLNSLYSGLEAELVSQERLNDRIELYESMILPQTRQQVQAALMAYRSEQSDFTEVMRAHIAQLESVLEFERLQTDRLKSIAALRYLLPPAEDLSKATAGLETSK